MTYETSKAKVLADLDLTDEVFFTPAEILGYFNEAIRDAERIILRLAEDYFLDKADLALVTGTSEYSLPSNIFADKIRRIVYSDGSTIYEIRRLRFKEKFSQIAQINAVGSDQFYQYMITNDATAGRKLTLFPASRETSASNVTVWYIRNANILANDTDEIDIPEFNSYIEQFVKVRLYEKEGHPNLPMAVAALKREQEAMEATLGNRFPDEDDALEMDLSHYQEST